MSAARKVPGMSRGWRRVDGGSSKIGARYAHDSGYTVAHCGHPTALWPYQLWAPDGAHILAPNGRAWRTLADISAYVDVKLWGGK